MIALLALTLTSLGLAAGLPSTVGTSSSDAASLGTSTASGRCSKAEATAVVKRLGLSDPSVAYPVYKVLCGAFTGPGSQTMVVSLWGPGASTGMIDWVVFRWAGGAWQLLMKRHQAAMLTAAGSDIKETVSIFREGDPRCCPSGGTRARIWHWNGKRLVAGPWKQVSSGPKTVHLGSFVSPDRNIWCLVSEPPIEVAAWCGSKTPVRAATLKRTGAVTICTGNAVDICFQNWASSDPVLRYGQRSELSGFRCSSEKQGITCTVIAPGKGYGKGFLINRTGVSRVGP